MEVFDGVVYALVLRPVEVLRLDESKTVLDRVHRQEHRTQQRLLGLVIVRWHPLAQCVHTIVCHQTLLCGQW